MDITIVGSSKEFAHGIATWAVRAGHDVTVVGPSRARAEAFVKELGAGKAADRADRLRTEIILTALPYVCLVDAWQSYGRELDGKVLVDLSVPVDIATGEPIRLEAGSAAEEIAVARPRTRIVKAFNPTFAGVHIAGQSGKSMRDVLLAADDADAKALVTRLFETGGMHAIDVGPLRRARELEAVGRGEHPMMATTTPIEQATRASQETSP